MTLTPLLAIIFSSCRQK